MEDDGENNSDVDSPFDKAEDEGTSSWVRYALTERLAVYRRGFLLEERRCGWVS